MRQFSAMILALIAVLGGLASAEDRANAEVDFNRDIRPILSQKCFKCHGPDELTREADLRLDERAAATADLGDYWAIKPGDASASEIIARVTTDDPDLVMPPPSTNKSISADELETLTRWIGEGAEYAEHWSFVPPAHVELPQTSNNGWCRNPIDRFVLAKLDDAGWTPSAEAERYALVRRVYLDLIGLPPTPDEADAFVNDASPDAYERLVDTLLESPHYGERWARRWLDIARYADTNGYEKDRPRSIWPYRDWVINALNEGLPYDEFIVKQLAGDMLPADDRTERLENLVATGFHRNTMINEEGGTDPLEFRFYAMVDRTNTTGTALFGLTLGCTQCHTHKYDPITQTEYYGIMAFLNNADEPTIELPDVSIAREREEQLALADRLAARRLDEWRSASVRPTAPRKKDASDQHTPNRPPPVPLTTPPPASDSDVASAFTAWAASEAKGAARWHVVVPHRWSANLARFDEMSDGSLFAQGDVSKEDWYELTIAVPAGATSLRIEALPDERLPSNGPGRAYYEGPSGDFMLADLTAKEAGKDVAFVSASASFEGRGFGKVARVAGAIDDDKHTGWSIGGRPGERHVAVFRFAEPIAAAGELDIRMLFFRHFAAPLGRFRLSVTTAQQPTATNLSDNVQELLLAGRGRWSAEERDAVFQSWLASAPEIADYNKRIADLRRTLPSGPSTLVMRERPAGHARETHRHHRGEFLSPEEPVDATVPAALGQWPDDRQKTRLEFAKWLVSSDNPLAARVKVNRDWEAIFGVGLVKTLDDFGSQGDLPSHPQLLDWLTVRFVESGWDVKALHRLIVTSATYRQASSAPEEVALVDPDNRLMSHGPRTRLDAEFIRDTILTASDLLTRTLGGPSVYPPQPAVVAKENFYAKFEWKTETGPNRYRRGLYTFAKRTNPYAMFSTFDGPTGQVCIARREKSNTPLQALTMLNDTVVVEAAQKLGRDAAARDGDAIARASWIFRRCLVRPPAADELEVIVEFYNTQLADLASDKDRVGLLMSDDTATPEQAAWMLVARAILNTDELIVKR